MNERTAKSQSHFKINTAEIIAFIRLDVVSKCCCKTHAYFEDKPAVRHMGKVNASSHSSSANVKIIIVIRHRE